MARIRSLKPEFWDDRKLARSTSRDARMLYMGLWNQADEHGRLNGDLVWIKGRVFSYDDDLTVERIKELLDELDCAGRVERYEVEGDPYLFLPKLGKHQRLEAKVESRLPQPPPRPDADESRFSADESAPDADESALSRLQVAGVRGQGDDPPPADLTPPQFCSKHPNGTSSDCRGCQTARLKAAAWAKAEPERRRRAADQRKKLAEQCLDCGGSGWLETTDGLPAAKCNHQHRRTG